jgi:hypothetical protein
MRERFIGRHFTRIIEKGKYSMKKILWVFCIFVLSGCGMFIKQEPTAILPTPNTGQTPEPVLTQVLTEKPTQTLTPTEIKYNVASIPLDNQSPILGCSSSEAGWGWAVSMDALWQWDGERWVKINWPSDYQITDPHIAVNSFTGSTVWIASNAGVIIRDNDQWKRIPSPLDNYVNQARFSFETDLNNKDYWAEIVLVPSSSESFWMYLTFHPEDPARYVTNSMLMKWDQNKWNIIPLQEEEMELFFLSVVEDNKIWGTSNWFRNGNVWLEKATQYLWNGEDWQISDIYQGIMGEAFDSYNPQDGSIWLFTEPGNIRNLGSTDSLLATTKDEHFYRIYHWSHGKWELINEIKTKKIFRTSHIVMYSIDSGWQLLTYGNDQHDVVRLEHGEAVVYPLNFPESSTHRWSLCPVSGNTTFLFSDNPVTGDSYNYIFNIPEN